MPIPDIIAFSPDGQITFYEIRNRDKHSARMFQKYEGFESLFDNVEVFDVNVKTLSSRV